MVHDVAMDAAPTLQDLVLSNDEEDDVFGDDDDLHEEYEVEEILRYRRLDDGEEYFLVKWIGFPHEEATWEPIGNMNDNCRELVAKARALFAWRRPPGAASVRGEAEAPSSPAVEFVDKADHEKNSAAATGTHQTLRLTAADANLREERGYTNGEVRASPQFAGLGTLAPEQGQKRTAPEAAGDMDVPPNKRVAIDVTTLDADTGEEAEEQAPPASVSLARPKAKAAVPSAMPAKKPQAPATPGPTTAASKAAAAPPKTTTQQVAPREPPKEMKCMCGSSEVVSHFPDPDLVVCKFCNCALHVSCVRSALGQAPPDDYACPPCRMERVDDFHPPVGPGLLRYSYAQSDATVSLSFPAQAAQWRKQAWSVHLRAVTLSSTKLSGPAWPHRVQGKLNGRQCVTIDPPKHLHVRREQCYNLTPLLRQGVNTLELRMTRKPDKTSMDPPDEEYCVGVVLTRPRTVASIVAKIRNKSQAQGHEGDPRERVSKLLSSLASYGMGGDAAQDDCMVSGDFGRRMKPICPISHCPIVDAAIGRSCNHIQVFDLQSYICVNQRMRSLENRWTCPVCSLPLRPDDVVLEPFVQDILHSLKGQEDNLEAVVFNDDCTYTTISVEQAKEEREAEQAEKGNDAEVILSDSE